GRVVTARPQRGPTVARSVPSPPSRTPVGHETRVERLSKVHASDDLGDDDRGDYPVDDHAERWPPPGIRDEVGAVLPEIFEAVADEADDEEPWRAGDCGGGDHHEAECHAALDGEDVKATVPHRE